MMTTLISDKDLTAAQGIFELEKCDSIDKIMLCFLNILLPTFPT